jgi:hypothetical protein
VMTMIILASTPWLLRPWKMHFFFSFIYHLCIMHVATAAFVFPFYLSERSAEYIAFHSVKIPKAISKSRKKYINIPLSC